MTTSTNLKEGLAHSVLVNTAALVGGCPNVPGREEQLARLRQALIDLPGEVEVTVPRLTLGGALSLCNHTLETLEALSIISGGDEASSEMGQALSEALSDLASRLSAALRQEKADKVRGLYVIIDPEVTGGREPMEIARAAVRGGAKMLQLRDKLRDKGEILPLARELQALCEANDVLLIINDHVDLAAAVGSGGVHVGQTDLPVAQARQVLSPEQVLGRSNREIDLLIESQEMGADHVAFGAIYQTTTKSGGRGPQGPERLKEARAVTRVPLVAIGGITADNVAPVIEYGADAVCVTAAVGSAADPEAAAARLVEAIRQAGGKV